MSNVSLRTVDHPWKGRVPGHVIHFRILHPLNFSAMAEHRISNFVQGLAQEVLVVWWQTVPQAGVVKVTWRLNFWQISVNILTRAHHGDEIPERDVTYHCMVTYLPLNYDTLVLRNIFEVTRTYLMDVDLRQEALLLQRNRATHYVSWNIMAVFWLSYWQEALLIQRNHASTLSVEIV